MRLIEPTHGLLRRRIVIVQISSQQLQPVLQQQDAVVHEVARTTLDEQNAHAREILSQPAGDNTAGRTAANNDIVIAVDVAGWDRVRGRHGERLYRCSGNDGSLRIRIISNSIGQARERLLGQIHQKRMFAVNSHSSRGKLREYILQTANHGAEAKSFYLI